MYGMLEPRPIDKAIIYVRLTTALQEVKSYLYVLSH
jgi:hypothetical protein